MNKTNQAILKTAEAVAHSLVSTMYAFNGDQEGATKVKDKVLECLKEVRDLLNQKFVEHPHRIVCAALKYEDGTIVTGVRHYDEIMLKSLKHTHADDFRPIQGFVDNRYQFWNREESYKIALAAGQIARKTGGETSTMLFSEDIY